jgi:hypothetical protein
VSVASLFHSIQSIGFLKDISESALVYPIIMTTHLTCIAVFGGMILMTDMRLLGLALQSYTVSEVVTALRPWKRLGGTIMITMGLLLAGSEADKYYGNPFFWAKLSLLACIGVHAVVFRPLVYNKTQEIDNSPTIPGRAKLAAILSLTLWFGVLTMGRLIGYYEPPQATKQASRPSRVLITLGGSPDAHSARSESLEQRWPPR